MNMSKLDDKDLSKVAAGGGLADAAQNEDAETPSQRPRAGGDSGGGGGTGAPPEGSGSGEGNADPNLV
jgi:hypothetical protein